MSSSNVYTFKNLKFNEENFTVNGVDIERITLSSIHDEELHDMCENLLFMKYDSFQSMNTQKEIYEGDNDDDLKCVIS